jgi:DNA-binding Lrp family transcriptional regulator
VNAASSLDRIDRKILAALQADARLTNQALSDRVALSPSACLARVRRLEREGFIQGYHARLDPFSIEIGLVLFAEVVLRSQGAEDLAEFDKMISEIPQIVEASHVSGNYDYLLKVVVADLDEWARITERLTANGSCVDRLTTLVLLHKSKVFVGYPVPQR